METVYLCDRCGQTINPTGLLNLMKSKVYFTKLEYVPAKLTEDIWAIGKCKILCDKCSLEFSKWWDDVWKEDDSA